MNFFCKTKNLFKSLICSAFLFIAFPSWSLDFTPTPGEWAVWSEMCKARYVVSGAGRTSVYQNKVPVSVIKKWEEQVGPGAWYGLHHYCAALHKETRGNIQGAIDEYMFSYTQKMPTDHYLHAEIGARLAQAHYKLGNKKDAFDFISSTISLHPNYEGGYIMKAIIERNENQISQAIKTLKLGNKATKNTSAEINYHLGLAYLKTEQFDLAKEQAIAAEKLGYPLSGLKQKLQILNAW